MRFKIVTVATAILFLGGLSSAEQDIKLAGLRQVRTTDLDMLSVAWGPDGSTLAMTGAKYEGIYLMDVHSNQITTVTQQSLAGYRLAWSPDGRQIAYKALVESQAALKAIMLANLETGGIKQLSGQSSQVGVPSWFPDGRIGFTFEGDFHVTDGEGQVLETIADIASNVAPVSHDGQWILYNDSQDAIWACHLTDGERFQVTPQGRRFFNPVWSPKEAIALVNELGGGFYLLDIVQGTMLLLDDGNHYAWSPDGQRIVYDITTDDGHYITSADIYTINKDGTGKAPLTATSDELEMYPSWSANDRIAFSQLDGKVFTAQVDLKSPADLRRGKRGNLKIQSRR